MNGDGDTRHVDREAVMGLIARADPDDVARLVAQFGALPEHSEIRSPETGLVMVRGRMGGRGGPFNLGEATVTRCTIRLSSGEIGHSYVLGRDPDHARKAAIIDAMRQSAGQAANVDTKIVGPLRRLEQRRHMERKEAADRTRVDFFTVARGED